MVNNCTKTKSPMELSIRAPCIICPAGHDKLDITDKEFEEHQFHTIEAPQTTCSLCSSVMAIDVHKLSRELLESRNGLFITEAMKKTEEHPMTITKARAVRHFVAEKFGLTNNDQFMNYPYHPSIVNDTKSIKMAASSIKSTRLEPSTASATRDQVPVMPVNPVSQTKSNIPPQGTTLVHATPTLADIGTSTIMNNTIINANISEIPAANEVDNVEVSEIPIARETSQVTNRIPSLVAKDQLINNNIVPVKQATNQNHSLVAQEQISQPKTTPTSQVTNQNHSFVDQEQISHPKTTPTSQATHQNQSFVAQEQISQPKTTPTSQATHQNQSFVVQEQISQPKTTPTSQVTNQNHSFVAQEPISQPEPSQIKPQEKPTGMTQQEQLSNSKITPIKKQSNQNNESQLPSSQNIPFESPTLPSEHTVSEIPTPMKESSIAPSSPTQEDSEDKSKIARKVEEAVDDATEVEENNTGEKKKKKKDKKSKANRTASEEERKRRKKEEKRERKEREKENH